MPLVKTPRTPRPKRKRHVLHVATGTPCSATILTAHTQKMDETADHTEAEAEPEKKEAKTEKKEAKVLHACCVICGPNKANLMISLANGMLHDVFCGKCKMPIARIESFTDIAPIDHAD